MTCIQLKTAAGKKRRLARPGATRSTPTVAQVARARRLLATEIDFIHNPSFLRADAVRVIQGSPLSLTLVAAPSSPKLPPDLPAHLARMCERPLLTAQQERELFRRMNYLNFRANTIRVTLDPDHLDVAAMSDLERLLADSKTIRDHIIQANMRLVIAVVKKFVTPQHSFDDMLSEGIMTLMHAVDKFDYDRGFRFSTYAYRSIARSAFRSITDRQRENGRFSSSDEVLDAEDAGCSSSMDQQTWESLRGLLSRMMQMLDRREQFILRGRYALGAHRRVRTFQLLADKLGVSKERVRQLEQRAVTKLQRMASELCLDEWVAPSMI